MDTEFPGNSRNGGKPPIRSEKSTPIEDVKLEGVVTGKVIRRKKPVGRRLRDTFFAGDGVLGYLGKEVLLPALQNLITDFVTQGVNRAVYGDAAPPRNSSYRGPVSRTHVSYNNPSSIVRQNPTTPARRPVTQPDALDMGDIIVGSHVEAETVVERLGETIEEYGCATVANLNDLLGQTSAYTDSKWGWTDISGMYIKRIREGFLLQLPEPKDLR